ncbi:MAG: HepT-like ribonuclease domain-containing protein [Campylobacterota bacterium]
MSKALRRIETIAQKLRYIDEVVAKNGGVMNALEDEAMARPSILMHLTSIAEQFDKLSKEGEFEILSQFDKRDLKGSYDLRNYIVHDYEGLNLPIIETVIRQKLPKMKTVTEKLLKG